MIDMKKIMYYPLWRIDELEECLHELELFGLRLSDVKFSCVFYFVKSNPKDSDYVITYNMPKDRTPCMYEYEQKLLSEHFANKIPTENTGYDVFRITGENRDFQDIKDYRKSYFKHVLFQQLLIAVIFLFTGLFMLFAALFQKAALVIIALICIYTFLSLIVLLYRMYGYIIQSHKCKK